MIIYSQPLLAILFLWTFHERELSLMVTVIESLELNVCTFIMFFTGLLLAPYLMNVIWTHETTGKETLAIYHCLVMAAAWTLFHEYVINTLDYWEWPKVPSPLHNDMSGSFYLVIYSWELFIFRWCCSSSLNLLRLKTCRESVAIDIIHI